MPPLRPAGGLLALVAALAGCHRAGGEPADRGEAPYAASASASASAAAAASASAAAAAAASASASAAAAGLGMPGPGRGRGDDAVQENAACESCHATEAAEWRGSHHQQAGLNPAYRRALAVEPLPFCRGCHVPEGDPRGDSPPAVEALGVGCVTCHVTTTGEVLAAGAPGRAPPAAPHAVRREPAFAASGACAGCHEFRFPGASGEGDERFMQTTVREHERAASAARPCAGCHMPARRGGRSHAFAAVRDPAWLRAQLRAAARRDEDGVTVTLRQVTPGHGFPSGDLFRRLEVGVEARDRAGRLVAGQRRYLARHFELVPGYAGRLLTLDNRVFDDPATVALPLPAEARGLPLTWWVTYQRVATVHGGHDPASAPVESQVPLARGTLR